MSRSADAVPELKDACITAALEFVAEHGVEQLSLRAVARHLGVSHQAPYKHYPSRDHLLSEVMRRCFRGFAAFLDDRPTSDDPEADLSSLGERYLAYAAQHPLEYRLMFGTTWPAPAEHAGLVDDAVHAFDVLRTVLRRRHGDESPLVDLDAMYIWSTMHGVASLLQGDVMVHLGLSPATHDAVVPHAMRRLRAALHDRPLAATAAPRGRRTVPARTSSTREAT
jgi:AcrR family transcriptional regulator